MSVSTTGCGSICLDTNVKRHGTLALGLRNGALLTATENAKFDVLLTVNQGIEYEQNLSGRTVAVIILWRDRFA